MHNAVRKFQLRHAKKHQPYNCASHALPHRRQNPGSGLASGVLTFLLSLRCGGLSVDDVSVLVHVFFEAFLVCRHGA